MASTTVDLNKSTVFTELESAIHLALETYSNVHRGNGHFSMVTTHLFDRAREIVLEYLGLNKKKYLVIFCTPRRAATLTGQIEMGKYQLLSSQDIGLSLGVTALAVLKKSLPEGVPFQPGGGTARLISKDWVIWARGSDKFEAGTPAIINIIAFAKALRMIQYSGKDTFRNAPAEKLSVAEILYHDELDQYSGSEMLDELRKTLIGRGVSVPTVEGIKPFINLDNSASTPTFTPVWNAFRRSWRQSGELKQEIVQEVKSICSVFLNAPLTEYEIIFTSNTTEAINLAAESFRLELNDKIEPVVISTLLEHSSNDLPWRAIPNGSLIRLSVDADGFIDLIELEKLLISYNQEKKYGKKQIKLVAVSGASNVLGICNDLALISRITHRHGARLLVDGSQLVAHRKVDMEAVGIDYLAFSAHKLYAPFGCGVLVVRKGLLQFEPAEQGLIRSSGEENAGGIAALGKALVLLQRIGMNQIQKDEQALTKHALVGMARIPGLKIHGVKDPESPLFADKLGVIPLEIKKKIAYQVAKELAIEKGIGVRSGCHCAHITVKHILHVGPGLEKFQKLIVTLFPKLSLPGVVRASLGIENTKEEVDRFIQVLGEIANKSQSSSKKEVQQQIKDFVMTSADRVYN